MLRLVDRHPALSAAELAGRLVPPRRFAGVRFATYHPDPAHPSQAAALAVMERFGASVGAPVAATSRWGRRRSRMPAPAGPAARYLDGGYGVGKTHLLASLFHASPGPAAYLTFAELAALVGHLGMAEAVRTFAGHRLVCIDEFELDDVANTLMTVSFLREVIPGGTAVAATSNTLPDRLGEGRFAADDFVREIAAIAAHFEVVRLDGPDYRARSTVVGDPVSPGSLGPVLDALAGDGRRVSVDAFDEVLAHLRTVPPVQVGALLDGLDAVVLTGLAPIGNQGDALLFVHLVDEIYDAEVAFVASGCPLDELFPEGYRHGGYRKKYGRCESRLGSLLGSASVTFAT